ncbi:alpha-1,4-glucan--maltose-1-phosphate maltosyltransferase [Verticiella sediminum]
MDSPGWAAALRRAEALGFSHILCAPGWTGAPEDALAVDEPTAADPAFGMLGLDDWLRGLAAACERQGLSLWLDLSLARAKRGGSLHQSHPDWFSAQGADGALDPRLSPRERSTVHVQQIDGNAPIGLVEFWMERMVAMLEAGVQGFRLLDPAALPGRAWRSLIEGVRARVPACAFTAWTPGMNPQQVQALEGAAFDAVYSSLPWWDYRDDWYVAEHERLARAGRVIVPVADPDAASRQPPPARALLRALRTAAELGDGLLMPRWVDPGEDADRHWSQAIAKANLALSRRAPGHARQIRRLGGDTLAVTWMHRKDRAGDTLVAINTSLEEPARLDWDLARSRLAKALPHSAARDEELPAAGVLAVTLAPAPQVVTLKRKVGTLRQREALDAAIHMPRIAIQDIRPSTEDPTHLVKRVVGEALVVHANIFMDGHDVLAARLLWRAADEDGWHAEPMVALGNDAWRGSFTPERIGRHEYTVQAWRDVFGTYRSELAKKHAAGIDVSLEVIEGRQLLERAGVPHGEDIDAQALLGAEVGAAMAKADLREFEHTHLPAQALAVERRAARFASWYEMFPRSQSGDPQRHGTFRDVIERLPYVRDMGFDVLYFPPIHPIGRTNRKGRNNSLKAGPDDPGSPYAIGGEAGGHDAIHPELGTLDDFRALVKAAAEHDLEIALDFAVQCSPDHPWLREHPEWFSWRPDGSMRYAENPPKKYEDIVNVDYYGKPGKRRISGNAALWLALRDVVLFWCDEGVRTFRVDNPHTKPLPFWQWMIAEVQARYPDAIFLSEAFTRPNMMYRLAKIGFSQSYTYFTWRNDKREMTEYLEEIANPPVADVFRPNFFVNTPDINPYFLQTSGRGGYLIRAALATTLSGLWGMYNGFELCEGAPVPGKEEYLDSEKYEVRAWDWERPGNIRAEIAALNRIRRANPALHTHRGVQFLGADNEQVLYFCKATPERDNVLLIAISMDPHAPQGATIEVPLWQFGLPDDGRLRVHDLLHENRYDWHGKYQRVDLHPDAPYAIFRVSA